MSERFSGYDAKRGTRVSRSAGAPSSVRPSISVSREEYERNRVLSREYYSASQRMDGRESAGQAARRAGAPSSRYGSSRYGGASGASSRSASRAAARPADSARSSSAYRRDGAPSSRYAQRDAYSAPRREYERNAPRANPRPSGNRYASGARPPRRKKKGGPKKWIALLVCLALAFYFGRMAITLGVGTPRFYAGVTVNGMDLAGYTYEEGLAALQQAVSSQLDSTYTLSYAGCSWAFVPSRDVDAFIDVETQAQRAWNIGHTGSVFSRQQQVLQLRENPIKIDSSLVYDAAKLEAFIAQVQSEIDTEPVDAMVMLDVDGPKVYGESSTGLALDAEALRQTLVARMESGGALDVALPVEIVEPGVSSESAAGGLQKIVEVRTDATVSSSARLSNIKLAMQKINLYILEPGQQFSYNAVVGARTEAAGFKEATAYSGATVTKEVGGGICQVSSTLYEAALLAGLQIDERHPHSMTVAYTEAGKDATVSESGNQDLKFTNNTEHTIYIYAAVDHDEAADKDYARITLFSAPLPYTVTINNQITNSISYGSRYERDWTGEYAYYTDEYVFQQAGKPGCHCSTERIFYDAQTGEEILREHLSDDVYNPLDATYWVGVHNHDGSIAN